MARKKRPISLIESALDAFFEESDRGDGSRARFELEYLVAVGRKR